MKPLSWNGPWLERAEGVYKSMSNKIRVDNDALHFVTNLIS